VPGVLFLNGKDWQEQRRFALKTLRDFGLGKDGMEALIAQEVARLIGQLEDAKGEPQQMRCFFNMSALRTLWSVMTSEDLLESKHNLQNIWERLDYVFSYANNPLGMIMLFTPMFSKLLESVGIDTFSGIDKDFATLCTKIVDEHERSFQDDSIRDFTDSYIKFRMEHMNLPQTSFHGSAGLKNQVGMMIDVMQAGTETASKTLEWALLFMIVYPDIANKVKEELDGVTGGTRLPCWADRSHTPYTEAVITEIQRCASVSPNAGFPRVAKRDINIMGFNIPKGTHVWANTDYLVRNPKAFPNPGRFNPEHHYKDGKHLPHPHVIPFGYGKRRCLGETLARMELYRFFTGLLHHFNIKKRPGDELKLTFDIGSLRHPSRYYAVFEPRK